jgi:hypothetical protein
MRARVTQATLNDLQKLVGPVLERKVMGAYALARHERSDNLKPQVLASLTIGQRTVLRWPRMLSLDEFEAVAAPMQDALIEAGREDCRLREGDPGPKGLEDVTHRYRATR